MFAWRRSAEKKMRSKLVERLKRLGYPAFILTRRNATRWIHVVHVGPFGAYEPAARKVMEIASKYRLQPQLFRPYAWFATRKG